MKVFLSILGLLFGLVCVAELWMYLHVYNGDSNLSGTDFEQAFFMAYPYAAAIIGLGYIAKSNALLGKLAGYFCFALITGVLGTFLVVVGLPDKSHTGFTLMFFGMM